MNSDPKTQSLTGITTDHSTRPKRATRATRAAEILTALAVLASLLVTFAPASFAQGVAAPRAATPAPDSRAASELYEEAANYARRKYEELEREGFSYDAKIATRVESEQRSLASRHAAALASRPALAAADELCLAQLYELAGDSERAVSVAREYLRERPEATRDERQTARFVVAVALARQTATAEAESALAEYLADDTPPARERRYRVEIEMAAAYRRARDRGRAIEHGRAAFDAARALVAEGRLDAATRDEILYRTVQFLSDALHETRRTGEAIAALQELRRLSVSFPSADLYRRGTLLLSRIVPAVGLLTAPDDPLFRAPAARPAPEIEVRDWIGRKPTTLAAERGRVVLIAFWAAWCAPCRAALPAMSDWQRRYAGRGLSIIALSQYSETRGGRPVGSGEEREELRSIRRAERLPYGFAVTDTPATALAYGVTSVPAAALIDRRGVVRYLSVGSTDDELKELEQMIVRLLDEPAGERK